MRSFLKISPKKNWVFVLFKTFWVSIISLETFDKVSGVLAEKLNLESSIELSSLFEYFKVLILNKRKRRNNRTFLASVFLFP